MLFAHAARTIRRTPRLPDWLSHAPTPQKACYFVHEPLRKTMLMRWSTAFAHALLSHVRCSVELEEQLKGVLTPQEVEAVCAVGQSSAPSFVVQVRGVAGALAPQNPWGPPGLWPFGPCHPPPRLTPAPTPHPRTRPTKRCCLRLWSSATSASTAPLRCTSRSRWGLGRQLGWGGGAGAGLGPFQERARGMPRSRQATGAMWRLVRLV
jgi:hypothetical protein